MKKNMGTVKYVVIMAAVFLLLGAKGCEVKNKADIIEGLPEFEKLADKFEIEKNDDWITLTTYDNLSFREAVALLKKTPMNKPVSFYDISQGELQTKVTEKNINNDRYKNVRYYYDEERPYRGVIYLLDGWWRAIEIDASSMSIKENADNSLNIIVNEFSYANEIVLELNDDDMSLMSLLDSTPGTGKVKGDGSTPDITVSEFER
jgi:hypothetical protein